MNKVLISVAIALVTAGWMLGPVQAWSCTASGWGYEECSSGVLNCSSGAYLDVTATVDDGGSVWGHVFCSNAGNQCSDTDGHCYASAGPTSSAGNGQCEGNGNGGGTWTRFVLTCNGVSAQSPSTANTVKEIVESVPLPLALTPALDDLMTPDTGNAVWLFASRDVVQAFHCEAGEGCVTTIGACATKGDLFTCRV